MSMIWKILGGVGALLVLLLAIILFRTFSYGGTPAGVAEIELPEPPATIQADAAVRHLGEAIRFRTVTRAATDPQAGEDQPWLDLHQWLIDTYPATHSVMQREIVSGYTLLYTWTGSDPSLDPVLMMAHQDVVPVNPGTEDDWGAPAFSGEVIDGYIYGRGTMDDKASLVGLMEAAEALVKSGFKPKRTIIFLFGHNEEVSGTGARDAVALLKSRNVHPEIVVDEGYFVIDPSPITGKTMGFIGIAEKGYVTLTVTALATGGHSSTPPRESANVQLSRAIIALDENQMSANFSSPVVADMFKAAGPDMSFMQRMALANLWLFKGSVETSMAESGPANAMIRTTTAPTMLTGSIKENVLPQRATALVNFRVHPEDTVEDVLAHARAVTAGIEGIEVDYDQSGSIGSEASPVSPIDNRAYAVLNAVAMRTGNGAPVAPALVLGATDARWASDISDNVYRFAPSLVGIEDLQGFHGTNERLAVENVRRLTEGYTLILMAMASE